MAAQRRSHFFLAVFVLATTGALAAQDRAAPEPIKGKAEVKYYMCVFSFDTEPRAARTAHTFATFVKSDGKGVEAQTISWWPQSNSVRLIRRFGEPGVNLSLRETLDQAAAIQARIQEWGPFEIKKELFDRALKQIDKLKSDQVAYKALDRRGRPEAINCIHAVSDIDVDNGMLQTGTAFGADASAMVVEHLSKWIITPEKKHTWLNEKLGLAKETISGK